MSACSWEPLTGQGHIFMSVLWFLRTSLTLYHGLTLLALSFFWLGRFSPLGSSWAYRFSSFGWTNRWMLCMWGRSGYGVYIGGYLTRLLRTSRTRLMPSPRIHLPGREQFRLNCLSMSWKVRMGLLAILSYRGYLHHGLNMLNTNVGQTPVFHKGV